MRRGPRLAGGVRAARVATAMSPAGTVETITIAAAGDIACPYGTGTGADRCRSDLTARLLRGRGVTAVLALGDLQYDSGRYDDFLRGYDQTWGDVIAKTFPAPGNHDYGNVATATPEGYFRYFGDRVRGPGDIAAYSVDLPVGCTPGVGVCWHVISLSSELCFGPGGCTRPTRGVAPSPGQRTWRWLRSDLRAHPDRDYACTIAIWHHPLFSISSGSGATSTVRPLFQLLHDANADIVLNGHSHNYQRWAPRDADGRLDPASGIRAFVVGTGGVSKYTLQSSRPDDLRAAQDTSFGVLRLTLAATSYSWEWVTAAGQPAFEDSGTADCVRGS